MSLTGKLLVARPEWYDPNFFHTVTLLLEHSAEEGAFGVVLNRPTDRVLSALFPRWHEELVSPRVLFSGGPVHSDGLVALARPTTEPGPLVLGLDSIDLATDPPDEPRQTAGIRIFAGAAGWGAGQLEAELASDSWWVVDAELGDVFWPQPAELWTRVLLRASGQARFHAHLPPDVRVN